MTALWPDGQQTRRCKTIEQRGSGIFAHTNQGFGLLMVDQPSGEGEGEEEPKTNEL